MKKGVCVGVIFCFITIAHLYGMTVEERAFREELETPAEMDVSHEEYRKALAKILEPGEGWDADLRYVLFPLGAVALTIVVVFFIRQIRMNLIVEARDDVSNTPQARVETERAALVYALQGRDYILPDDIKFSAPPVYRHRILLKPDAEIEGLTPDDVIDRLLAEAEIPR